jgi:hypothetical protein
MCDYSVVAERSRLAVEGEELVAYRFASGSIGLVSPDDATHHARESGWRAWFSPRVSPCAVCVPPGARLLLWDLPERIQQLAGVGPAEMVTMVQATYLEGRHRDGVLFRNHQQVLLQRLSEGQRLTVISLSSEEPSEPEPAVRYEPAPELSSRT